MDRNTLTGLLLIGLVLIIYNYYLQSTQPPPVLEPNDTTAIQSNPNSDTNATTSNDLANNRITPGQLPPPSDSPFASNGQSESFYTLENEVLKLTLSNKGGRIYKAELKDYQTSDSTDLVLLDGPKNTWNYQFSAGNYIVATQSYFFEAQPQDGKSISFRLYSKDKSNYIEQTYTLDDNTYMVNYDFNIEGGQAFLTNNPRIELDWVSDLRQQERTAKEERNKTSVYFKEKNDNVNYLSETSDDKKTVSNSMKWISFKQHFFNYALIADNAFQSAIVETQLPPDEDSPYLKRLSANLSFEHDGNSRFSFPMQLYIGPNDHKNLQTYNLGLEGVVNLGWSLFSPFSNWIIIPIFNFFNRFLDNYGLIILFMTLTIKGALSPLTYRSYMSMAKMGVLKPEIEALKTKYGDDAQKIQTEQLKLYSRAGVNPLGGCLPQLLQMPILIAMYYFFPVALDLRQESFLWATDLSTYDSILDLPFNIPIYGSHVSLFTLLSSLSSVAFFRLNSQMSNPGGADSGGIAAAQMKIFQYIMPVMLLFIFNSFSAALTFYFFLSNVFSFLQQLIIKKFFINEDKIRASIHAKKGKPAKKSRFQKKLEEMVKAQQEIQRQQQTNKKNRKK